MITGNCFILFTGCVVTKFLTMAHHNSLRISLSPEMHSVNTQHLIKNHTILAQVVLDCV